MFDFNLEIFQCTNKRLEADFWETLKINKDKNAGNFLDDELDLVQNY